MNRNTAICPITAKCYNQENFYSKKQVEDLNQEVERLIESKQAIGDMAIKSCSLFISLNFY
ncbi:MAG: hypothetical protein AAGG68_06940 [Bacteroidota bacterium]